LKERDVQARIITHQIKVDTNRIQP